MLDEYTAYQANPLVEAIKYESIDENRLFLACVQQLNPHLPNSEYYDKDFKDITIPMNDVINFFGGNDKYYNVLVEVSKKLLGTYIFIEDKEMKAFRGYTVFEYIEFGKEFGGLHFKFTNSMKPFLLDLYNKGFTGINLKEVFNLRSSYALRILEMLLQYKGMADKEGNYERTLSFERLRKILNVKGTYKNPSLFLKYVIQSPVNEINKKTRYTVNYTVQRKGKKAIGVTFQVTLPQDIPVKETIDVDIIESTSKPKKEDMVDNTTVEDAPSVEVAPAQLPPTNQQDERQEEPKKPKKRLEDFTREEAYALAKLLKFKVVEKVAFATLEKYGVKAINWAVQNYQDAKNRGVVINNPAGFILDKIAEYDDSEITAEDIFKLVEKFKAEEEQERIKAQEEAERQKAEDKAKEEAEKKARLEIRKQYTDAELLKVLNNVLSDYKKIRKLLPKKCKNN